MDHASTIVHPRQRQSRIDLPDAPALDGHTQEIPRLRQRTAGNLVQVKRTAAHAWTSVDVGFEHVARIRVAHAPAFKEAEGLSLTYLTFVARATIDALAVLPWVNALFDIETGTQRHSPRTV
jgi:2-oxoglutarate dehydrogenase E2 component (dihydrolipoamide succinyltransferase)